MLYLPNLLACFNSTLKKHSFIVLLCIAFPAHMAAEELVVAFGQDRAPYVMDKGNSGIEVDIFKAALAHKNHTLRAITVTNKRAEIILKTVDEIDAVATVILPPDDGFYSVSEFIYFDNYAITKKKKNLTIEHFTDLAGLQIIAFQGFYNLYKHLISSTEKPNELSSFEQPIIEFPNQERQNDAFWRDRADAIIIDKAIFNFYRHKLREKYDTSDEVVFHPIFPNHFYYAAVFVDENIANDFQQGLNHIKQNGQYDRIYEQYHSTYR